MSDSPAAPSPYEVLGVRPDVSHDDLRRAYRRLLRETHPDTGGTAAAFQAVQRAWELVGDPEDRARYDRGESITVDAVAGDSAGGGFSATFHTAHASSRGATVRARSYGHPGGRSRERFLSLMREWMGRGTDDRDPYDPALVRSAPREIRQLLAVALAEEATARAVSGLGIGFTIWNDVAVHPSTDAKIDHIVLGPAGLFAIRSADWGAPVKLAKGEVVGEGVGPDEEPFHDLYHAAKSFGRQAGVRFTGYIIVVPDDDLDVPFDVVRRGRLSGSILVRRSLLPRLLRDGADAAGRESVDRAFELRTRLQEAVRFV
ncbi:MULTISPECIES: nuclease-related domain-containing protein [Leifsonia]|uniref:Curved DNA-binding protein CbpA n=1 Tax=Leifsonia soli TaxID=582665 RepID=A0A852SYT3_9MICO|nr:MULTISPECIES: nuclease-related domain-containing protein [Leifsonia]NYD73865.1 curved DNA-binding protein CbpA [Leifsonia soli]SEA72183.1 Nuclease-related domain-containing protein [Leifsonia sp. 21MFCrub1.1]